MQDYARWKEIKLEIQTNRKRQNPTPSQPAAKKYKSTSSRFGGQKGRTCNKCGKFHDRPCIKGSGCRKCGNEGHSVMDYKKNMCVYFNYKQLKHFKAECPLQKQIGEMQAPEPATLRIIEGHQWRVEAPMAKGRAF